VPLETLEAYRKLYEDTSERETRDEILKDVPRTLSGLSDDSFFDRWPPESTRTLARILTAGTRLFGEYKQGMNFVAAVILREKPHAPTAFALFAYLMHDLRMKDLYGRPLAVYLARFAATLSVHAPRADGCLRRLDFEPQYYAVEWFSALFCISVPKLLSLAILDLVFARIPDTPLRVATGLLRTLDLSSFATFDEIALRFKPLVRAKANAPDALLAALDVHTDADLPSPKPLARPLSRSALDDSASSTRPARAASSSSSSASSPAAAAAAKGGHFDWIFNDLVF